jgi:hypothetical protein
MTPSYPSQSAGGPDEEIFQNEFSIAPIERRVAYAAFDLTIDGLRPGLGSDELIVRTAVRALEWFCLEHDRPNIATARLFGSERSVLRRINANTAASISAEPFAPMIDDRGLSNATRSGLIASGQNGRAVTQHHEAVGVKCCAFFVS